MILACMSQLQTSILAFIIKSLATKPGKMQHLDGKKRRPRPHIKAAGVSDDHFVQITDDRYSDTNIPLTQPPPAST